MFILLSTFYQKCYFYESLKLFAITYDVLSYISKFNWIEKYFYDNNSKMNY